MSKKLPFIILALLTITVVQFLYLGAQQKRETQELQHEVTVTLKLIQVYVMDKDGNPITDLRPDEFTVFDNKQLQSITEFERYILFPLKDSKELHPEAKNIEPSDSQDKVMNRKIFLFFDLVNNNYKGFQKAQEAALHFLDNNLHPSDEVGLFSYSVLKQLTLHEYLTTDHQLVRDIINRIAEEGRVGRAENFEAYALQRNVRRAAFRCQSGKPTRQIRNPCSFADTTRSSGETPPLPDPRGIILPHGLMPWLQITDSEGMSTKT